MISFSLSHWCSFRSIPSAAEASWVSESCLFSLGTLEINCSANTTNFALTECEHTTVWRWAIVSPEGVILDSGREPTQLQARTAAERALGLVAA